MRGGEFLKPLWLTEYRLANNVSLPPRRINEIVHGKGAITTDTVFRPSQYFGNSAQAELLRRGKSRQSESAAAFALQPSQDLVTTHLGGI